MGHSLYFLRNAGVFAIALAAASAPASAQNTIITADKMIDVLTGKTVDYPAVFVGADGRITGIAGISHKPQSITNFYFLSFYRDLFIQMGII